MKNWMLLFVAIDVAFASAASADPGRGTAAVAVAFCDNGEEVLLNFGTATNRSHQAFVLGSGGTISSQSIYVIKFLSVTDATGTSVIFDTAPSPDGRIPVTCTVAVGGSVLTARGFFTPAGASPPVMTTSSRLLCKSSGGSFGAGPDEILASSDPLLWVCNDFPVPFDEASFFDKLNALAVGCVADGGVVLFGTLTTTGAAFGVMDTSCYGPP